MVSNGKHKQCAMFMWKTYQMQVFFKSVSMAADHKMANSVCEGIFQSLTCCVKAPTE